MKINLIILMMIFLTGCGHFKIFDPKTKGGTSGTFMEKGKINQKGQQSEAPEEAMTQSSALTQEEVLVIPAGSTLTKGLKTLPDGSTDAYTTYTMAGTTERISKTVQTATTEVGASMNFEKLALKMVEHKQAAGTILMGVLLMAGGVVIWWKTGLVAPASVAILAGFLSIVIAKIGLYFVIGGVVIAAGAYLVYKTGLYKESPNGG